MMEQTDVESLLEFPCHYQFKAMGVAGESFKRAIVAAVNQYVTVPEDAVRCRLVREPISRFQCW